MRGPSDIGSWTPMGSRPRSFALVSGKVLEEEFDFVPIERIWQVFLYLGIADRFAGRPIENPIFHREGKRTSTGNEDVVAIFGSEVRDDQLDVGRQNRIDHHVTELWKPVTVWRAAVREPRRVREVLF
jgi:hypothetical protein